jgi:hypothetical protein
MDNPLQFSATATRVIGAIIKVYSPGFKVFKLHIKPIID